MIKCPQCNMKFEKDKELAMHIKYFHKGSMGNTQICPDCGANLMFQEGCAMCSCGYSRCG